MFVDANGNQFESYEAACYYYGCDTPAQIAAEAEAEAQEEADRFADAELNDALVFDHFAAAYVLKAARRDAAPTVGRFWDSDLDLDDECPF
jgi:hypothetical protein